jgi:tetratricopeptide (TPR) repeat protein
MGADRENARAAWEWAAREGQVARLEQALEGLAWYYFLYTAPGEGEAVFRIAAEALSAKFIATPADDPMAAKATDRPVASPMEICSELRRRADGLRILAKIRAWQTLSNLNLGRREVAVQLLGQAQVILEDPVLVDLDIRAERAWVLWLTGGYASDLEEALRLKEESLALYRALDDHYMTAFVLQSVAVTANFLDMRDKAKHCCEESLALRRSLGDRLGMANSLYGLAQNAHWRGKLDESERLVRESCDLFRELGHRAGLAKALAYLANMLMQQGKLTEVRAPCEESLALHSDLGLSHSGDALLANLNLSFVDLALGRYAVSRANAQSCLTIAREVENIWAVGWFIFTLGAVALADGRFAEAEHLLKDAVALGRPVYTDWPAAILGLLGIAARGLGKPCQANGHICEALRTSTEFRVLVSLWFVLPAVALLLADEGEAERAIEIHALASTTCPWHANSRWFEEVVGKHITAVATTLPKDVVSAAEERGRSMDPWATAEELLAELASN